MSIDDSTCNFNEITVSYCGSSTGGDTNKDTGSNNYSYSRSVICDDNGIKNCTVCAEIIGNEHRCHNSNVNKIVSDGRTAGGIFDRTKNFAGFAQSDSFSIKGISAALGTGKNGTKDATEKLIVDNIGVSSGFVTESRTDAQVRCTATTTLHRCTSNVKNHTSVKYQFLYKKCLRRIHKCSSQECNAHKLKIIS